MTTIYTKNNPFLTQIKARYSLCKEGSQKNTQHIVLDLKGSNINYQVGDSIAVLPNNDPHVVQKILEALKATGQETVQEKNGDKVWNFREFLTKKANLISLSRKFVSELAQRQTHLSKKQQLDAQQKEYSETRHLWDALIENQEVSWTPQEIAHLVMPLLPRFYSIASSMREVGEEVHLTVVGLEYTLNDQVRQGVCTRYLFNEVGLNERVIPIYIQPQHGFTVPEDGNTPIIMIGPGTGVAPFRAFMQERSHRGDSGKNWLFFGERHREHHFFYEDYWKELESRGKLRLSVAFSRDQEHKVYVQHRMQEHASEIFRWLEEGANFYVCGDAHKMAKDVEETLLRIVMEQGRHDEENAKKYVKKLRTDKRYLRDVY